MIGAAITSYLSRAVVLSGFVSLKPFASITVFKSASKTSLRVSRSLVANSPSASADALISEFSLLFSMFLRTFSPFLSFVLPSERISRCWTARSFFKVFASIHVIRTSTPLGPIWPSATAEAR